MIFFRIFFWWVLRDFLWFWRILEEFWGEILWGFLGFFGDFGEFFMILFGWFLGGIFEKFWGFFWWFLEIFWGFSGNSFFSDLFLWFLCILKVFLNLCKIYANLSNFYANFTLFCHIFTKFCWNSFGIFDEFWGLPNPRIFFDPSYKFSINLFKIYANPNIFFRIFRAIFGRFSPNFQRYSPIIFWFIPKFLIFFPFPELWRSPPWTGDSEAQNLNFSLIFPPFCPNLMLIYATSMQIYSKFTIFWFLT